jgi:hypothetical protein
MMTRAPCAFARSQWASASSTRTITECVTSPDRGGRPLVYVANDHRSLAEAELRAVVLADPYALHKPERRAQPVDGLAHVRVDEDRNDGGCGD